MPESIFASRRFEGKANDRGSFYSPPQTFSVSHELIFSAAQLTIIGQKEGRTHFTIYHFKSPGNNGRSADVPDREPTIVGAYRHLSRLPPGDEYELRVDCHGFSFGEDVSVTVDLLELDSTVAEVTRDVLRDAESKLFINAFAFGISEASFTSFMTELLSVSPVDVGKEPYLKLWLDLESAWIPPLPFVHIDVSNNEFVVLGKVLLDFFRAGHSEPVASVSTILNVYCEPAMVTGTGDTLQIHFRRAEVMKGSTNVHIFDDTETGILGPYTSVLEFNEEVNTYLDQIVSNTGPLGFALPAYLESRSMPDHWHHVLNMELNFEYFDYRTAKVHGLQISYLFIVFSVRSLDLPPPCYCESELASLRKANVSPASIDLQPSKGKHKQLLSQPYGPGASVREKAQTTLLKEWDGVLLPRPDYYRIMTPAQIAALGLSQQTFREIARPYASIGHDESTSTRGTVYKSVRFWFRTTLNTAEITSDGIKAAIDITAEGSAKAAVRDRCGHDVLSASARLRIGCKDFSIGWSLRINETTQRPNEPVELTVEADPKVNIGDIKVDFAGVLDPPRPFDHVDDWVLTTVSNKLLPSALKKLASEKARIRLISTVENDGAPGDSSGTSPPMRLHFVDDRFFPGEAAVVLGELMGKRVD